MPQDFAVSLFRRDLSSVRKHDRHAVQLCRRLDNCGFVDFCRVYSVAIHVVLYWSMQVCERALDGNLEGLVNSEELCAVRGKHTCGICRSISFSYTNTLK